MYPIVEDLVLISAFALVSAQQILNLLCGSVMTESVQSSKVTLTSNVLACLKKRMVESGSLALRTLSVLALTLGGDEQEFFDGASIDDALSRTCGHLLQD